jgi:hypothetical protein
MCDVVGVVHVLSGETAAEPANHAILAQPSN